MWGGWAGNAADTELATYLLEKAVSLDKIIVDSRYPSLLVRSVCEESRAKGKGQRVLLENVPSSSKGNYVPAGTKLVIAKDFIDFVTIGHGGMSRSLATIHYCVLCFNVCVGKKCHAKGI